MWSNRWLITIKIRWGKAKFTIPLSLVFGLQLLDYLEDVMAVVALTLPRKQITINHKEYHIKDAARIIKELMNIMYSVKYCEPFDIVDIQSGNDVVKISIR